MTDVLAELDALILATKPEDRPALVVALAARLAIIASLPTPRPPAAGPERNLSVKEAAARLGVSTAFCYKRSRELGGVRLGRRLVFPERVLARYMARQ
jgi:excisionase family DNA binding protein